jgi:hypothetical protein
MFVDFMLAAHDHCRATECRGLASHAGGWTRIQENELRDPAALKASSASETEVKLACLFRLSLCVAGPDHK